VANHVYERLGHSLRWQHQVDQTGRDGALRHAGMTGCRRFLRHDDAAFGLDEAQARRTVAAGARQDDTDRPLLGSPPASGKKTSTGSRCARGLLGLLG
jgi:hypothetical protein